MSPERIAPDRFGFKNSRPTVFSDCYALGMVVYETISSNFPFHRDTDLNVSLKVVEGKYPPRGAKFTTSLWGMLEWCWAPKPTDRPTIEDVLRCLEMASDLSEPSSPSADEEIDEDGDWDSETSSSGGDSLDFFATDDHAQLPPIHPIQDGHLDHLTDDLMQLPSTHDLTGQHNNTEDEHRRSLPNNDPPPGFVPFSSSPVR